MRFIAMDTALPALSTEEIQQFITNGFLVKRKILDPKLCAAARDRLWGETAQVTCDGTTLKPGQTGSRNQTVKARLMALMIALATT